MAKRNDELLKKLLAMFRIEADEHLKAMSSGLLALENPPAGTRWTELVEKVFREAHSLKGAARAVNLAAIESVCQSLESVFAALKDDKLAVSPLLFDLLHRAIAFLGELVASDADASRSPGPAVAALVERLTDALKGALPDPEAPASPAPTQENPPEFPFSAPAEPTSTAGARALLPEAGPASETVRVSVAKLDTVMRQVEELLSPRLASAQRAGELRGAVDAVSAWKKRRARIQPALRLFERTLKREVKANGDAQRTPDIPKLIEYLDAEQLFMKTLEDGLAQLSRSAERDQRALSGMIDNLLDDVKEMHVLPFSSLLELLPPFARELARDQGKDVVLTTEGDEIEIDRRILEEIKAPLIHMLRNCIDHGIERPAAREEKGKPSYGTISLAISQKDSGKVDILVADDGAGIDADKVKAAACKLGIVTAAGAEKLSEQEALALIFRSGISTSPIITDVSGRGLGLAIVQEKIEGLGGAIALESHPDSGTAFRIVLPLTLATFRGVLVRVGAHLFVVPTASVERVARIAEKDIRTVENRETMLLDGQPVPLVRLGDVLEIPRKGAAGRQVDSVPVVVLGLGLARVAFRVEEILGEQEVLVKPLGPQLVRVRNVGGASVLGTGRVVPVLNVADLVKSAVREARAPLAQAVGENAGDVPRRSILVVEDSITARTLLKNILESAGYRITTAMDGIDAYTTLKTGTFDLVVSDVDMPRMNGFDLTAKVRADKQLAELPIVLVTSLESREHRERGVDVGANAYIVKSGFDQSNLLEIVQRLI